MTDPIQDILGAFDEGHAALLVTGRSLRDLVAHEGHLRPMIEALRATCLTRYGMHLVTYSLAGGLDWDAPRIADERDRRAIEQALKTHELLNVPQDDREVGRIIRGVSSLARSPVGTVTWADGRPLHWAFLLEFAEHLTPGSMANGSHTSAQVVAIELAHLTGHSLALRKNGNLVIFHGRDALIDELVASALRRVHLPQPDGEEKRAFLGRARGIYTAAAFEDGLSDEVVAHLATNTPNRGLEALLRSSHRTGRPVTSQALSTQKSLDVQQLSDGSLTVLDSSRVDGVNLQGRNIAAAARVMERLGAALRVGVRSIPATVVLVGPPGNGKTDLAVLAAREAGVAAYRMHSPKRPFVGQTEMTAVRQQALLREWVPNVAFVDEITEALPLERQDFDGDSGASRAVMAELLTALSDESRRGRSLLVATTNCPWRIGAAMRSRFTFVPVLHPLPEDFPAIVVSTVGRLVPDAALDPADDAIVAAGRVFYDKGVTPRHVHAALAHALTFKGRLTSDVVRWAARDCSPETDLASNVYTDLWAIRCCSSRSFLPWSEDLASYPFPAHLREVVDRATGEVRADRLRERIEELRPHANV